MAFLDSTQNINMLCPINQLGYGVTGLNISKALHDAKHSVALFVVGNLEAPEPYHQDLKQMISNSRLPDWNAPCIRIWHQHDMSQFVGKGDKYGFPIFELDGFVDLELHHLSYLDYWFVTSEWSKSILTEQLKKVFGDKDITDRIFVVPLGVDRNIFRESVSNRKETIFYNCGKWETRKGHDILVQAFN